MRVAWTRVDCGTSVLRRQGVSLLLALPGSPVLCSTRSPGDLRRGAPDGRTWQSQDSWGCRQRCALVRTPGVAQPGAGLPSLSGTCVVTPETKAAVSSGRQSSHRVTCRCPQEGTLGCGGQLGAESWSPSETRGGGGQLGAGGLKPVRDMGWGGQLGAESWSLSETQGGGQLGAGAGAHQSDSPLGRGSSLWLVALEITLFFRK